MTTAVVSAFPHDFRDVYKQGLQSHRASSDLRQHVSLVNSYAATSLINIPVASQVAAASMPGLSNISVFQNHNNNNNSTTTSTPKSSKPQQQQQHPPLTASNSIATTTSLTKAVSTREHRKLDRSISEPVKPAQPNSSRYKTELCRPFEENGTCKYGDKCQFAHGVGELRTLTRHPKYKTELCRTFHTTGFCPYGPRCHFIHNNEDSKKCLLSTLQSSNPIPVNGGDPELIIPHHKELELCSFSLGSAGDLSPTSSTCSSGSPTSPLGSFFVDVSFSPTQVPHTAPPTLGSGLFFGADYSPLKPLSPPPLVPQQEYLQPPSSGYVSDDCLAASIDLLISGLDNVELANERMVEPQSPPSEPVLDANRNLIRLPIFSRLAHGNNSL